MAVILVTITLAASVFEFSYKSSNPLSDASLVKERVLSAKQFDGQQFKKSLPTQMVTDYMAMLKMYLFDKQQPAAPIEPIDVISISKQQLVALQQDARNHDDLLFFRLGHSTLLVLLNAEYWLIDPMFSMRASPFGFAGPKRFHQPPISIDQLPAITGVIISHNHYDHLDKASIEQLIPKVAHFYTPLGVGEDLIAWGVDKKRVTQLNWWESVSQAGVRITATPARHFSGRALSDTNSTFWAGWALRSEQRAFFYSGDSGYFDGFKKIGQQLGPFDISFVETGAYNSLWPDIHMMPAQSAQAHLDVQARFMVPIHNGTFDLSVHSWTEPFEKIMAIAQQRQIQLTTPRMGQLVSISQLEENGAKVDKWWQQSWTDN